MLSVLIVVLFVLTIKQFEQRLLELEHELKEPFLQSSTLMFN